MLFKTYSEPYSEEGRFSIKFTKVDRTNKIDTDVSSFKTHLSVSASHIKSTMKTKAVMIRNHEVLVQILNVITFLVLFKV